MNRICFIFLGTSKISEANVNFVMSACLHVRACLCSDWTDFHEIWYLRIFWRFFKKIQVGFNLTKQWVFYAKTYLLSW